MNKEMLQSIKGLNIEFETLDGMAESVEKFTIKSIVVGGKHFIILRLRDKCDIADISIFCKFMKLKYNVKEMYVFRSYNNDVIYYVGVKLFNWFTYRNILFSSMVCKEYKDEVLKKRYGGIDVDTNNNERYYIGELVYKTDFVYDNELMTLIRETLLNLTYNTSYVGEKYEWF